MTDVLMPRLSDSMEQGTILRWLMSDGAEVSRGDELVEIETDKATVTYEADDEGVLKIVAREGETVEVGAPIASLGAGTADQAAPTRAAERESSATAAASAEQAAGDAPQGGGSVAVAGPAGAGSGTNGVSPGTNGRASSASESVRATPLARRIAERAGVNLESVRGTGPHGRVTRADVAAAAGIEDAAPVVTPGPAPAEAGQAPAASLQTAPSQGDVAAAPADARVKGDVTIVEPTRLQQTIARRMSEAKATVPEFGVATDVDMTQAVAYRGRLKELAERAPSVNDLIVQAAARALRSHPRVNASYRNDRFELHERVHVGIAVAAPDALLVPVIRDADRRTLGEISAETRRLAEAARTGTIKPTELEGSTFTVSNLGMFGATFISPVINLPNAAILGVGALVDRPVVVDGEITVRTMLTLTLTCDHRIVYGADAAAYLATLRELLEQPERIALSL